MIITNFTYTGLTKITALCKDAYYIWIAFLGSGGNSTLYKASVFNPNLKYFTLTIPVEEITRMKDNSANVFLALDDADYVGRRIIKTNPLGTANYYNKPAGITEKAVDLAIDATYVYFLIPGEDSGDNAKVLKFNLSTKVLASTIELDASGDIITDASSMCIDSDGKLWVVTNEAPSKLVKIDPDTEDYETWELI